MNYNKLKTFELIGYLILGLALYQAMSWVINGPSLLGLLMFVLYFSLQYHLKLKINPVIYLVRNMFLKHQNFQIKSLYFFEFLLHCLAADHTRLMMDIYQKYQTSPEELALALNAELSKSLTRVYPRWSEIVVFCFVNYRQVYQVSIHEVEGEFYQLIPEFKEFLLNQNLPLIIENYRFYKFLKTIK